MKWVRTWYQRFDNWWFGSESPASLALLRVLLGACAVFSLIITLFVFNDFYSKEGYTPASMVDTWLTYESSLVWEKSPLQFSLPFEIPRLNVLFGDPPTSVTLTVYLSTLLAAVLFTLGLFTRVSGFALALGLLSIQLRNPFIIHSGDSLMRLCIFYLVFSPCGRVYSLDYLRKRPSVIEPVRITSQRLIQYQLAIVYVFTAWWKFFGTYWMDGTATWYPSQMHEFMRFPAPAFLDRQPFVALGTYGTLATELALGTLVFWRPARKWVLLAGIGMHSYIEYRFNIPMFAIVIVCCYVAFYDGGEVERWVSRMKAKWVKEAPVQPVAE